MKKKLFIGLILASGFMLHAQVGVNTENPQSTLHVHPATLVKGSAEGIIAPRLTLSQLQAKDADYANTGGDGGLGQTGSIVYVMDKTGTPAGKTINVATIGYYYFDGALWQKITPEPWRVAGTTTEATLNTQNIYQMGNVGVGNNNPAYKFDVSGNSRFTGNMGIGHAPSSDVNISLSTAGAVQANQGVTAHGGYLLKNSSSYSGFYSNGVEPGIGCSEFVNARGSGTGGFMFYCFPGTGTPAAGHKIVEINRLGKIYAYGGLRTGSQNLENTHYSAMYWNTIQPGRGETEFINASGTGGGGFLFYSFMNTDTPKLTNQILNVDRGGNIIPKGSFVGTLVAPSDGRIKKDIKVNIPGLNFINQLRPVSYYMDFDKKAGITNAKLSERDTVHENNVSKVLRSGFIAQEVESAAKANNYDFEGVIAPKNDNDIYTLNYSLFVVPLVKAVQEQQAMIENLKKEIEALKQK